MNSPSQEKFWRDKKLTFSDAATRELCRRRGQRAQRLLGMRMSQPTATTHGHTGACTGVLTQDKGAQPTGGGGRGEGERGKVLPRKPLETSLFPLPSPILPVSLLSFVEYLVCARLGCTLAQHKALSVCLRVRLRITSCHCGAVCT